jgi:GNAT superfamily N-acetyltransferase
VVDRIVNSSFEGAFTVRRSELDLAIEWAACEGWNPGLHDADAFFPTNPHGFFLGILGDEPIGCVSAVAYNGRYGFIGFYVVRPEFRRRGFGKRIRHAATSHLGTRSIGLDDVVAQRSNYEKSGSGHASYRDVRRLFPPGPRRQGSLTCRRSALAQDVSDPRGHPWAFKPGQRSHSDRIRIGSVNAVPHRLCFTPPSSRPLR